MPPVMLQQMFEMAIGHHQAGRLGEAERIYREILAQYPRQADALHMLGVVAQQAGRHQDAVGLIREALGIQAEYPEAWSNLGVALRELGRVDEAVEAYRRAIAMKPEYPEALNNLGRALRQSGRFEEAAAACRRAVALRSDYADAWNNLGAVLRDLGRSADAIAVFRRALAISGGNAEVQANLGGALQDAGRLEEAIAAYRAAVALKPGYAQAHYNLGGALRAAGRFEAAAESYRRAIAVNPTYLPAYNNLGVVLNDSGRLEEGIAACREAVALDPGNADAHGNLVFSMHYHAGEDARSIAAELARWSQRHAEPLQKSILPHANERSPGRRLKIGYQFMHSVSFFLLPLLEHHDKSQVHVTCYTARTRADHVTERLRAASDAWRHLGGVSDEDAAAMIRRDQIDILVDLSGHTSGNRLLLLARRPAPVQVTFLGFPGSTGLRTMDYRFTDAFADPPALSSGTPSFHTEELIRLPDCAWCFAPLSGSPAVSELPALRQGGITFGSFNSLAKVTPQTLDMWAAVLKRVAASRLILKNIAFCETETVQRFERWFSERGIDARRLELLPAEPSQLRHLETYNRVDIALDTFPYHGTTTTCEALWMGVPVITLAGGRHASRVGVSLLSNLGLPELAASDVGAFVEIASGLVADLPRLAELRRDLRGRMQGSVLMDGGRYARHVETAYRAMWRKYCAGEVR